MSDKRQNKVEKTRIVQKNKARQILNKRYSFIGAKIRKPIKWLMDGGVGERALCIVRVQLTIAYLSSIKKQNKSYLPRIRTNQKTKKSGTQDTFSTSLPISICMFCFTLIIDYIFFPAHLFS